MRSLTPVTARLFAPLQFESSDRLRLSLTKEGDRFSAELFRADNGNGENAASYVSRNLFVSRVPERRKVDGWRSWEFGATDTTVNLIAELWPPAQVEMDEDCKTIFDYLLVTSRMQEETAATSAQYTLTKQPPEVSYEVHPDFPLAPYQRVALHNMIRSEGYGLFMEQGTGKTPVVIAAICNLAPIHKAKTGRMYRAIIVCPKNVRLNWESEFQKFATRPGKVTIFRGGEIERMKLFIDAVTPEDDCDYTVVVCSYESMVRSWNVIQAAEWDLAVLDESHFIKSYTTKRTKHAMLLRDVANRRVVLTGTPITNTPLDLFTQFEFLGKGWSGFVSWTAFKEFYGSYRVTESGHRALVGVQNMPFMQERLAKQSFIIHKAEALPDLPDKVYDVREVTMTVRQIEIYETVRRQLAIEIERDMSEGGNKALIINNVLTKLLRLAQITSGFVAWDPRFDDTGEVVSEREIEFLMPNPKLEAVVELLKEKEPNEKTIVWACWVPDLLVIHRRLLAEGIKNVLYYGGTKDVDRDEAVRTFNYDRDCRVFLGNPAAGGTGLNLLGYPPERSDDYETNVTHEVYYSQNWSPTARSQSEDRAHRRGTRTNVRVTDLCVPGTIDEKIRARVMTKIVTAYEISNIRDILYNAFKGQGDD